MGQSIDALNDHLIAAAAEFRPGTVWFDKALFVRASTVRKLRESGSLTVHYNPDNPFGPIPGPGWRLFRQAIPEYDLHLVPRQVNLKQYHNAGARDVQLMQFSYEPSVHFPPPEGWSDIERRYDVVFIGAPHDSRAKFILELWERHGISVFIWGDPKWERQIPKKAQRALWQGGPVWDGAYRETIWRSRICLGFITHSNDDDMAHRAFEITACGGFLLAEKSQSHLELFAEGKEAAFFTTVDDCAAQIERFLADENRRAKIAEAGHARAQRSGYTNDERISKVFEYISRKSSSSELK